MIMHHKQTHFTIYKVPSNCLLIDTESNPLNGERTEIALDEDLLTQGNHFSHVKSEKWTPIAMQR